MIETSHHRNRIIGEIPDSQDISGSLGGLFHSILHGSSFGSTHRGEKDAIVNTRMNVIGLGG